MQIWLFLPNCKADFYLITSQRQVFIVLCKLVNQKGTTSTFTKLIVLCIYIDCLNIQNILWPSMHSLVQNCTMWGLLWYITVVDAACVLEAKRKAWGNYVRLIPAVSLGNWMDHKPNFAANTFSPSKICASAMSIKAYSLFNDKMQWQMCMCHWSLLKRA